MNYMTFVDKTGKTNGPVFILKNIWIKEIGCLDFCGIFLNFHLKFLIISLSEDADLIFEKKYERF